MRLENDKRGGAAVSDQLSAVSPLLTNTFNLDCRSSTPFNALRMLEALIMVVNVTHD
jgi:hypothetical protein